MASSSRSLAGVGVAVVVIGSAAIAALKVNRSAPQPVALPAPTAASTSGTATAAAAAVDPPPVTAADTEREVRAVCTRLIECAAGGPSPAGVAECMEKSMQQAADPFSRSVLASAYRSVREDCGKTPCDQYANCYMDSLKRKTAELLGGAPPKANVAPATRARIVQLVCKVSRERPGHLPDLNAPGASPEAVELRGLIDGIHDPAAIADIMKEALATCEPH